MKFRRHLIALSGLTYICCGFKYCVAAPESKPGSPKAPTAQGKSTAVSSKDLDRTSTNNPDCIALNNEGVRALNSNDFLLAIKKFQQALKIEPYYKLARMNLAIANNNYALTKRSEPATALKYFHASYFLDPKNTTTRKNIEGTLTLLGKSKDSFKDRKELGEQAEASGDYISAIIEYGSACEILDDAELRTRIGKLYEKRKDNAAALQQFLIAKKLKDTPEIESQISALSPTTFNGELYMSKVQAKIKHYWKPVPTSGKWQKPTRAVCAFTVLRDGTIKNQKITQSSGDSSIDKSALSALDQASPFERLPPGASESVNIVFTFDAGKSSKGLDVAQGMLVNPAASTPAIAPMPDPNKVNEKCFVLTREGSARFAAADYEGARKLYQQAFDIAQSKGDELLQIFVCLNLHSALYRLDKNKAIAFYKEHVELPRRHPENAYSQKYLFEFAGDYKATSQPDLARSLYDEAYRDYKKTPALDPSHTVAFLNSYVNLLNTMHEQKAAQQLQDWMKIKKLVVVPSSDKSVGSHAQ